MKINNQELKQISTYEIGQLVKKHSKQRTLTGMDLVKTTNPYKDQAMNFYNNIMGSD